MANVGMKKEFQPGMLKSYNFAKAIVFVSLLFVFMFSFTAVVDPGYLYDKTSDVNKESDQLVNDVIIEVTPDPFDHSMCDLEIPITFPVITDGTFSPPPVHTSVNKALRFVAPEDRMKYCSRRDDVNGFTDELPYNENGECGTWQEAYIEMHKRNVEQLERIQAVGSSLLDEQEEPPKFISYVCEKIVTRRGCGGLADRMGGMVSTFFYAFLTNRAYLANWHASNPIPMELVFDHPHIDWTTNPGEMKELFDSKGSKHYEEVDTLNMRYSKLDDVLFPEGKAQNFSELWKATYVQVKSNRGYVVHALDQSTVYRDILKEVGMTKENAYGCIMDFLFRPTVGARRYINAYRHLFQLPSILSIGIQIRTDDNALVNPNLDVNSLQQWKEYFECADALAASRLEPHHTRVVYFLISDSGHLKDEFEQLSLGGDTEDAKKYFPLTGDNASMVVAELPLAHIEPDQVSRYIETKNPIDHERHNQVTGVSSAIVENWLLSMTDYRVISPKGFGKLAAFHARSEKSTISMTENISQNVELPSGLHPTAGSVTNGAKAKSGTAPMDKQKTIFFEKTF